MTVCGPKLPGDLMEDFVECLIPVLLLSSYITESAFRINKYVGGPWLETVSGKIYTLCKMSLK